MKNKKLKVMAAALCAPIIGGLALTGSAFATDPTTYTVTDFGGDTTFFNCIKTNILNQQSNFDTSVTEIPIELVQAQKILACQASNMEKVSGINLFTSLETLSLYDQGSLKTVDISGNAKLEFLNIKNINNNTKSLLSTITIAGNTSLTNIAINDTSLETIDLSGATNVTTVNLYNNELATVKITQNAKIKNLTLSNNKIASIDLSGNTQLQYLYLYDNELTKIDVSVANKTLNGLYLDDNVLVRTNFVAIQIDNGGKYYASIKTNGNLGGMFIPMIISTGLSDGRTKITTPGATYYGPAQSDKCLSGDVYCILFDADITNYQNYIQLEYIGQTPSTESINSGNDSSKQNYRLEINLKEYDPSLLVPDTGFFTGQMDGTTVIIYTGAAFLGAAVLYLVIYSAKRGTHRNRFRK